MSLSVEDKIVAEILILHCTYFLNKKDFINYLSLSDKGDYSHFYSWLSSSSKARRTRDTLESLQKKLILSDIPHMWSHLVSINK